MKTYHFDLLVVVVVACLREGRQPERRANHEQDERDPKETGVFPDHGVDGRVVLVGVGAEDGHDRSSWWWPWTSSVASRDG